MSEPLYTECDGGGIVDWENGSIFYLGKAEKYLCITEVVDNGSEPGYAQHIEIPIFVLRELMKKEGLL